MRTILGLLFLLLSLSVARAQHADSILIGHKTSLYSQKLSENRKLWIYTPQITSPVKNKEKKYPVLYLLDGDAHFFSTVGIIQQLSQANGNGILPEMIVVAIENTNRLKNFTPASSWDNNIDKANPFVQFLFYELMPYIEKNFPAAPYKLLAGHSLGGLTVIDILTNYPQLFNAYIAVDPSMWYGNEKFLQNTVSQLGRKNLDRTRLFIGTANTLPKGMTVTSVKQDKTPETQHIRSILKLNEYLAVQGTGLKYSLVFYEKEKHNTVPLMSLYDGLHFVFDYYAFDASEKDFTDSTAAIAIQLRKHYANISRSIGYTVAAPEDLVNYLGYDALAKRQFSKAKALFTLNVESYPHSANVYDSYADFSVTQRDTNAAITYYQKALAIHNNPITARKLNALEMKPSFAVSVEDLQKYQGVYTLEAYQMDIILQVNQGKLWAKVPGQPDDELLAMAKDIFTVRGKQGYTITFTMNGNRPLKFTSVQPNGTFTAMFKQ